MNNTSRIAILLLVLIGIGVVVLLKHSTPPAAAPATALAPPTAQPAAPQAKSPAPESPTDSKLPSLLEFGAGKCMACQAMVPVVDKLRQQYKGKLRVISVDVHSQADLTEKYGITIIPQQVLLAPDGHEIGRHSGYWEGKAILAKFAELGFPLDKPADSAREGTSGG